MNPRATIFLDDVNGGSEDYRDNMPRPFDWTRLLSISRTRILVCGMLTRPVPEHIGKTVKFKGMVYKTKKWSRSTSLCPDALRWSAARMTCSLSASCVRMPTPVRA